MPRLYCETHGREDEASTIERQEHYRQEGESVLIVTGKLRSGPWLCDRCNETIDRGSVAYLVTGLPHWITEGEPRYDFAYERRYFGGRYDRVAVYGAEWPGIRTGMGSGPHAAPAGGPPAAEAALCVGLSTEDIGTDRVTGWPREYLPVDETGIRHMVLPMNDASEQTGRNPMDTALIVTGLAASGVAIVASGGLAIAAGAIAVLCLAGSVAACLAPAETAFDRDCRECDLFGSSAAEDFAQEENPEVGQSHRWRQSIVAGRNAGRGR